jgi:hypothetical protein
LYRHLRWNAIPDERTASETRIAAEVGAWAGRVVLGETVGAGIAGAGPVVVRVAGPAEAGFVAGWPLELAHAGGGRWPPAGMWRSATTWAATARG